VSGLLDSCNNIAEKFNPQGSVHATTSQTDDRRTAYAVRRLKITTLRVVLE